MTNYPCKGSDNGAHFVHKYSKKKYPGSKFKYTPNGAQNIPISPKIMTVLYITTPKKSAEESP